MVEATLAVRVDVDMFPVAIRVEQLDPELAEQPMQLLLVGRDPLAAELVRLTAELHVEHPAADTVAGLEHDDVAAGRGELRCGGQPCDACADNHDVRGELVHTPIEP